jgi:hypothetical protein
MPMPTLTQEEMKSAEDALLAEEQALKEKWCRLRGHRFDLPNPNPFNNGHLRECEVICNRCNVHAKVTVTLREAAASPAPAAAAAATPDKPAAAPAAAPAKGNK